MEKMLIRIKANRVAKLLLFVKPKEKSNFFERAAEYYLKNADEEELMQFANSSFQKDFKDIINSIKNQNTNKKQTKRISTKKRKKEVEIVDDIEIPRI